MMLLEPTSPPFPFGIAFIPTFSAAPLSIGCSSFPASGIHQLCQPRPRRTHHRAQKRLPPRSEVKRPESADAAAIPSKVAFCSSCGAHTEQRIPEGDERMRSVCTGCHQVSYENPKVVVGCVPISADGRRVLLTKRAIEPVGRWTFPAGFLELGETAEVGAEREAWEEARAQLDMSPVSVLAVYNILPARQVQILYRSVLLNEDSIAPGPEATEVRMFEWAHIPWDELAFPTVAWALQYSYDHLGRDVIVPHLKNR